MTTQCPQRARPPDVAERILPAHVVIVTNFIAAHRTPLFRELARRVSRLTILLSTPMEANRRWQPDWAGLDVVVQRTTTLPQTLRHRAGFDDLTYVHIPWDTVGQLRRLRPDVVLSAEFGLRSAFSAAYCKLFRRVPLVFWAGLSEHTELNKGRLRTWLRRRLVPRADLIVVNGESGSRYLQGLGIPRERIQRIHYTCLPEIFDRWPPERSPDQTYRLLTVGQLIERKGIVPFLEALCRWAKGHPSRQLSLTIAGSGPLESELRTFPRPPNLDVELVGQCDYDQLAEQYQRAGIFAFPSLSDDWGISVNEALTAGLPILGSVYAQSVDELCVEGETGWRYRIDVPEEVDRAVETALATPHERLNSMRVAARRKVAVLTPDYAAEELTKSLRAAMEMFAASRGRR